MPRVEVKRRLQRADLDAVSGLLQQARARGAPALRWEEPDDNPCNTLGGVLAWEAGHDHPIAYAQLAKEGDAWDLELVVDPAYPGPSRALGEELTRSALGLVSREGGGRVHLWAPDGSPLHEHVARAAGLGGRRILHQMRRPLPVAEAVSLPTRPFVVGRDEDEWLKVNRRAFAGQPDQAGWTRATLECRKAESWFDPHGFLLHERDGRLAGFCWTKVHATHPPEGEIYVLGVDPDFQGLGLGRQLVLAGLGHLSAKGLESALLYVDEANQRAAHLYRTLGFTVHREDLAYVSEVTPARDPNT